MFVLHYVCAQTVPTDIRKRDNWCCYVDVLSALHGIGENIIEIHVRRFQPVIITTTIANWNF